MAKAQPGDWCLLGVSVMLVAGRGGMAVPMRMGLGTTQRGTLSMVGFPVEDPTETHFHTVMPT